MPETASEYPTVAVCGRYRVVLTDPDGPTHGIEDADDDLVDDGYDLTGALVEAERLDTVDSCQKILDSIEWHLADLDLDQRSTQARLAAVLAALTAPAE